jgi:hypothetical protein
MGVSDQSVGEKVDRVIVRLRYSFKWMKATSRLSARCESPTPFVGGRMRAKYSEGVTVRPCPAGVSLGEKRDHSDLRVGEGHSPQVGRSLRGDPCP